MMVLNLVLHKAQMTPEPLNFFNLEGKNTHNFWTNLKILLTVLAGLVGQSALRSHHLSHSTGRRKFGVNLKSDWSIYIT